MNPNCDCPHRGFCARHKKQKSEREFQLCKGIAHTSDCGFKYWKTWELGGMGATAPDNPVLEKTWECDDSENVSFPTPASSSSDGLGDRTERLLSSLGVTQDRYAEIKEKFGLPATCNCKQRKEWLNRVGKYLGIGS